MRYLTRLLVSDWRRKLMALGLAFALWAWVGSLIEREQEHSLRIVATAVDQAVEPGTLQIRIPEEWTLTEGPGEVPDEVPIRLRGSAARIEAFLASGFSATLDPELDRLEEKQDQLRFDIQPSDLRWSRPEEATRLLVPDDLGTRLNFKFEKVTQVEIVLGPHLLEIAGSPPEDYILLEDEITFVPNQIVLRGPAKTIDGVILQINAAARNYDTYRVTRNPELEKDAYYPLLATLGVEAQNRSDINARLGLRPEFKRVGVEILEDMISVSLPVRLRSVDPGPRFLERDAVVVLQDPENRWELTEWSPPTIRREMSSKPDVAVDVNDDFLDRHLMFFLPLQEIPDSALEQETAEVDLEWTLIGLDVETKREIQRRLTIRFEDPDARTVTVRRKG